MLVKNLACKEAKVVGRAADVDLTGIPQRFALIAGFGEGKFVEAAGIL